MILRDFDEMASRVAIGKQWLGLKEEFLAVVEQDPAASHELTLALLGPEPANTAKARTNMARAVITAASLQPDPLAGLLPLVENLAPDSSLANALLQTVGFLRVEVVDELLGRLDLAQPKSVEAGFAIGQEQLIRHHKLGEAGTAVYEAARAQKLPATWLSPELHPLEADHRCYLPFGGAHRTEQPASTFTRPIHDGAKSLRTMLEARSLSPSTSPAPSQVRTAHEAMTLHSNGIIETALFDGGPTPVDAWSSKAIDYDGHTRPLPAWAAAQRLFVLSPGAYTRKRPVWKARLKMAQALSAFTFAAADSSFHDVMNLVDSVDWFDVAPAQGWAFDVAWDSGICAATAERAVVMVATDTD